MAIKLTCSFYLAICLLACFINFSCSNKTISTTFVSYAPKPNLVAQGYDDATTEANAHRSTDKLSVVVLANIDDLHDDYATHFAVISAIGAAL